MAMVRERSARDRIELQLDDDHASARLQQDIEAIVRYCVLRVERELGEPERWIVKIVPGGAGFESTVAMYDGSVAIQSIGSGLDGALAVWDALCSLEQTLREARTKRNSSAGRQRFDHS